MIIRPRIIWFLGVMSLFGSGCSGTEQEGSDAVVPVVPVDATATSEDMTPSIQDAAFSIDGMVSGADGSAFEPDTNVMNPEPAQVDASVVADAGGEQMMGGFICDPAAEPGSFHSMSAGRYPSGEAVSMCQYRGRVLLIANTAALCGFTPQYEQLQALNRQYEREGLAVAGFLTNDFGNQGGSDEEIETCTDEFRLTFDQFTHIGVTSQSRDGQHPIFAWLTTQPGFEGEIPWNFSKFLVDHEGRLIGRWDHLTTPDHPSIVEAITAALNARPFEPRRD